MRNLSELNINEGGKAVTRPAPTVDTVKAFQSHFGIVLPDEYLKLLQYSNGGHPELDSIQPVGRPEAQRWSVSWFYELDDDRDSTTSLWYATAAWRSILGRDALPFAEDQLGNQFFLDLSLSESAVKICIHDDNFSIADLAPSFEAFLDGLSRDPEFI